MEGPILNLSVRSAEDDWVVEDSRKYFCTGMLSHVGDLCVFCGYES